MQRLFRFVTCLFLLNLSSAALAADENRVAFVVGNAAYEAVQPLANPGNDALDISVALEALGFDVVFGTDMSSADLRQAIVEFGRKAENADVVLFYYAGHGFQADGRNYMLPVDAEFETADELLRETIDIGQVLAAMERSKGLKLVFLDACRDNPFGIDADSGGGLGSGLTRVGTNQDFLISFATQPDNVAYDGTGRNSFFTEAMLHHIYTPGQSITDMLINVRRDVLAATGGRQIPWDNSSLTRQFVFDTRPATGSEENLLFQVATQLREPNLLRHYLDRYPGGPHEPEVQALLQSNPQALDPTVVSRGMNPEETLWDLARRSRTRPPVEVYLANFPNGDNVRQARFLLNILPDTQSLTPEVRCRRLATHPNDSSSAYPGVPFPRLQEFAISAVSACAIASAADTNQPALVALLARATLAAGDLERGAALMQRAAAEGDLRALFTLSLLYRSGIGVAQDDTLSVGFLQRAAEAGLPDAMLNLAVALAEGRGVSKDLPRAVDLTRNAASAGLGEARYNLGVFSRDGTIQNATADASVHFLSAAEQGFSLGYLAAAEVYNDGIGVAQDFEQASILLLRGAAEDEGRIVESLSQGTQNWDARTIRAVQRRLASAGLYDSALDGQSGPRFRAALEAWRNGGFLPAVLTDV